MNVLLVNPKSPRNLSIGPEDRIIRLASKKAYSPPLGLLTVAALLPGGWNLRLIDLTFQEITDLDWAWSDAVFTTGTLPQFSELIDLIAESKKRGKLVVVGGVAAFHYPEELLKANADFVAIGEGEVTVPILLDKISRGEVGSVIRNNHLADLTESPVPRFDLLEMKSYVDMAIQFSRGCPFQCEFCDATLIFGRKVRTKNPYQTLAELQKLHDLGWHREIYIVDDNFVGNPTGAKRLLEHMIEWMDNHDRPFEFFTHTSINLANSPQLMDMMVRAGFTTVYIGIESTDRQALRIARKFQNVATDVESACRKINEAGLQIMAGTIIGMDGEKPGRDKSLIEFAARNKIPLIEVAQLYAYPGTDLWKRLKKEGRLIYSERDDLLQCNNLQSNFIPTRPKEDIDREFLNAMAGLYDPSGFLDRAYNHFLAMQPVPVRLPRIKLEWGELKVVIITLIRWGLIRKTRSEFWRMLLKAYTQLDRRRFLLFLRCCVALEHYLDLERDFISVLKPMSCI